MTGLLGIKYRYVVLAMAMAMAGAVGYRALHDEEIKPEQVDRGDFYCDVVESNGYLNRAFIRAAGGKAVLRFEPSGQTDHQIANYLNKGQEIVGSAVDPKRGAHGTFVATRENCTVTDHNGDTRIYALK